MSRSINPISLFKTGTEACRPSPRSHRLDESATSYSLTGCSPALPVSASPARLLSLCRRHASVNLASENQTICFFSGLQRRLKANYQHPGWAKSDDRSGPCRMIKLTSVTWLSEGTTLFVGSTSSHPAPGQYTETHACDASAPTNRAFPGGGYVRRYPLTYRAGNCNDRRHAICRCAKSWQTPFRSFSTSSGGVAHSSPSKGKKMKLGN